MAKYFTHAFLLNIATGTYITLSCSCSEVL